MRLAIVSVGGANFGSLRRACERIGVRPHFTADPDDIAVASHVILPGVGAAGMAMPQLRARGLDVCLRGLRVPLLGICLGMQLLHEYSEEGDCDLLGLLPGAVRRLPKQPRWPHMGWNRIELGPHGGWEAGDWGDDTQAAPPHVEAQSQQRAAIEMPSRLPKHGHVHAAASRSQLPAAPHPLLRNLSHADWFYFVHGYAASISPDTIAAAQLGVPFAAVVARGNAMGCQFHPEKSAASGRRVLENFLSL